MHESVLIRDAVAGDIEAMAALLAELFAIEVDFSADVDRQRRGLELLLGQQTAHVLVAEADGCVIGMCTMQCLVSTAEGGWTGLIEDLVVASGHRRHGVGSGLLAEMGHRAAGLGIKRLQLLVDRTNTRALDFYATTEWRSTALRALRRYTC